MASLIMTALNQNGESLTKDHCPNGRILYYIFHLNFHKFIKIAQALSATYDGLSLIFNFFDTELLKILQKNLIKKCTYLLCF
jgi:hypothetical protein